MMILKPPTMMISARPARVMPNTFSNKACTAKLQSVKACGVSFKILTDGSLQVSGPPPADPADPADPVEALLAATWPLPTCAADGTLKSAMRGVNKARMPLTTVCATQPTVPRKISIAQRQGSRLTGVQGPMESCTGQDGSGVGAVAGEVASVVGGAAEAGTTCPLCPICPRSLLGAAPSPREGVALGLPSGATGICGTSDDEDGNPEVVCALGIACAVCVAWAAGAGRGTPARTSRMNGMSSTTWRRVTRT